MKVFQYLCALCGQKAQQSSTRFVLKDATGQDYAAHTLGTWTCTCQGRAKKVKVVRKTLDIK